MLAVLDEAQVAAEAGHAGWLEDQQLSYVLAVACSEMIATSAGPRRAGELGTLVPAARRQRLSCADGAKGPRLYDLTCDKSGPADA